MRITFVSAVPAMLGAVAWGVWDAHISSLREVASESWTPPAHVWSRADPPTVAAEPGGEPLWWNEFDSMCGNASHEPETIAVGPRARADARQRLGVTHSDEPDPQYELTHITRIVAGATWHRWNRVPRSR